MASIFGAPALRALAARLESAGAEGGARAALRIGEAAGSAAWGFSCLLVAGCAQAAACVAGGLASATLRAAALSLLAFGGGRFCACILACRRARRDLAALDAASTERGRAHGF